MGTSLDDRFMVFVRAETSCTDHPDALEEPIILCASYEEARRIQRFYHQSHRSCVIRYIGEAGGGD
jgi:hypothetical protein